MADDGWVTFEPLGIPYLTVHPMHLVDEEDLMAVTLYQAYAGSGFGAGPLPEPGGLLDQAAATMACFAVVGAAMAALEPRRGRGD